MLSVIMFFSFMFFVVGVTVAALVPPIDWRHLLSRVSAGNGG